MIEAVWTWLCSLDWTLIIQITIGVVGAVLCIVWAWLTLVRNARRASE